MLPHCVVADDIRTLGDQVEDVKYIPSSPSHVDHSGGISALQKLNGATVLAGARNVAALRTDVSPQFGVLPNWQPGWPKRSSKRKAQ